MLTTALLSTALLLPIQDDALAVTLSTVGEYATENDTVHVKIAIDVKADTTVGADMLNGSALVISVDGKTAGEGSSQAAKLALKKGTKMTLEVPVDLGVLLEKTGKFGAKEPVEVKITLPGVEGASASIKVVKSYKDVDVTKLDPKKTRVALVTNFGTMVVAFRPDKAPNTVNNFIKLAKDGFYDGTRYHRVIKGFMIQGGDPNTRDDNPMNDGTGGPGYQIDAEFNDIKHARGVLSMARSADPNSAGSQFFVMHGRAPHLDNSYTAFGSLSEGLAVLDRICEVPVTRQPGSGEGSRPTRDVWLYRAVVLGVMK